MPPSVEILRKRLSGRGTETEEIINERFSFKDGSWQQFTELETNHINNIINSLRK